MIDQINSYLLRLIRRRRTPPKISCTESGLTISYDTEPQQLTVAWPDITAIIAFKRDCYSVDLICLVIGTANTNFEINEDSLGWDAFLKAAQENLPGMLSFDVWFPQVAFHAFETNATTLFERDRTL